MGCMVRMVFGSLPPRAEFGPNDPVYNHFLLLYLDQMLPRLNHVIKQEDINVSGSGMELLLKMAEGDMRRSLNILQASHMAYNKVDDEIVYKVNYYRI